MPDTTRDISSRRVVKLSIAVTVLIVLMLLAATWLLAKGMVGDRFIGEDINDSSTVERPAPPFPAEPTNPNVTGGSDGVGDSISNDPDLQRPSSAGGVDTNQIPPGNY